MIFWKELTFEGVGVVSEFTEMKKRIFGEVGKSSFFMEEERIEDD